MDWQKELINWLLKKENVDNRFGRRRGVSPDILGNHKAARIGTVPRYFTKFNLAATLLTQHISNSATPLLFLNTKLQRIHTLEGSAEYI